MENCYFPLQIYLFLECTVLHSFPLSPDHLKLREVVTQDVDCGIFPAQCWSTLGDRVDWLYQYCSFVSPVFFSSYLTNVTRLA